MSKYIKRSILYYPTINIPTDDWLRNAVLYWDEVSSIIPQDWEDRHIVELSPDIEFLMKEGQFTSVRPESLLLSGYQNIEEFSDEFTKVIDSEPFRSMITGERRSYSKIHQGKPVGRIPLSFKESKKLSGWPDVTGRRKSRIHTDKISEGLLEFLEKRGLAKTIKGDSEWYLFESTTALVYMSVLAKYLARLEEQRSMVIGTDLVVYERFNFSESNKRSGIPVINCDFKNLIPSPAKNVRIKDIVKFKIKRESNLLAFRKVLLDAQKKIAASESNEHVREIVTSFQEDMRKGLLDMAAVFKDTKIDLVFRSLKSIFNPKSSTLLTGAALLANERFRITGLPQWLEGVAMVAAGAIDIGSSYIDASNKQRAEDRRSAYSYLFHAQRKGLISNAS